MTDSVASRRGMICGGQTGANQGPSRRCSWLTSSIVPQAPRHRLNADDVALAAREPD
ncbi:MAG TPA: hypothetical protein VHT26_07920 [Trebonia sp.]|nr:hypothetical protein [Trebonia sp.]